MRRALLPAFAALASLLSACGDIPSTFEPDPTPNAALGARALKVRVDMINKTATVIPPTVSGVGQSSLIGNDIVEVSLTNMTSSALAGQRSLIRFDVAIRNEIPGTTLITPTFPTPPAGASGVLLFPFAYTISGRGKVSPSNDWDGAPHNFFNDMHCDSGVASDCARYEAFAGELDGGQTTAARTIGFEVDKDVTSFTVMMVVAADMKETPRGAISGSVSSDERGLLAGVTVSAAGATTTTSANGTFSLTGVRAGTQTITLSNLPSYCQAATPQTVDVPEGATVTVNFDVTCTPLAGSIHGIVHLWVLGRRAGITVSAGGKTTQTNANGEFALGGVPAGTHDLTVTNLPDECVEPYPQPETVYAFQPTFTSVQVYCDVPAGLLEISIHGTNRGPLGQVAFEVAGRLGATGTNGIGGLEGVPAGPATVVVGVVPTGCVRPEPQNVTIIANTTTRLNIVVECEPVTVTITGSIRTNDWPPVAVAGAAVHTASGQSAVTDAFGRYSLANVPLGPNRITVDAIGSCRALTADINVVADYPIDLTYHLNCD